MPVTVDGRIAYTLNEIKDAFYDAFAGSGTCYFYGATRPEQSEYVDPHWNEFVYLLYGRNDARNTQARLERA